MSDLDYENAYLKRYGLLPDQAFELVGELQAQIDTEFKRGWLAATANARKVMQIKEGEWRWLDTPLENIDE